MRTVDSMLDVTFRHMLLGRLAISRRKVANAIVDARGAASVARLLPKHHPVLCVGQIVQQGLCGECCLGVRQLYKFEDNDAND